MTVEAEDVSPWVVISFLMEYGWASMVLGIAAFIILLIPKARRNFVTMNIACVMIYASVYIEKGIALIIPGYTPDVLGQVYDYVPSPTELRIAAPR